MDELTVEVYEKLAKLQWLLHKQRMQNHMFGGHLADSTRGQGRILAMLKMQDGISTKDLSYILGVRISSLNESLSKLEKNGYITREPSESDKRVMFIKLTEKGRKEKQPENNPGSIFSGLSAEELKNFSLYLDKILAALTESIGEEQPDAGEIEAKLRERMGDKLFEHWIRRHHGLGHRHIFGERRRPGFPRRPFWQREE